MTLHLIRFVKSSSFDHPRIFQSAFSPFTKPAPTRLKNSSLGLCASNFKIDFQRPSFNTYATMSSSYPKQFPEDDKAFLRLDRINTSPNIYVLHFLGKETPDNRLTNVFLQAILQALNHVEKEWNDSDDQKSGAALITTGQIEEKSKFYSNGLDFENAIKDPNFFDDHLNRVYEKLLSFPIPTIASIGGHAFAAGFGLVMAHDYRVMNGAKGYLCMNEIDFGAQIPPGLYASLNSKQLPMQVMRKIVLEGHRFGAKEAHQERIVDIIASGQGAAQTLESSIELAKQLSKKAGADAYQSNKLIINAPYLSILREKNGDVLSRL